MFKPVVDQGELVTFHLKRCSKHIDSDHNAGGDGNDDEAKALMISNTFTECDETLSNCKHV